MTSATYSELEQRLEDSGYKHQRFVTIPDDLWHRLLDEALDPLGCGRKQTHYILYKNWTLLLPRSGVLEA